MTTLPLIEIPLIHVIESDDLRLKNEPDVVWFHVLSKLNYRQFQQTAAHYYEQLWRFNQQQAQDRRQRLAQSPPPNPESHDQATQRLLFERPTLNERADVIHQPTVAKAVEAEAEDEQGTPDIRIRPEWLHPNITPARFAGRPPKCFFAMLNGFLGVMLAGESPEPEFVHRKLKENPAFARTCGFTIPDPKRPDRASDIPSLRKLQQFDQIMTEHGLWEELALRRVAENLRSGVIQPESTVVHDTTHYHAHSQMKVVDVDRNAAPSETTTTPPSQDAEAIKRVTLNGPAVTIGRVQVKRVPVNEVVTTGDCADLHDAAMPSSSSTGSEAATSTGGASAHDASDITSQSDPSAKTQARSAKKGKKAKSSKPKRKSHPRTTKNCRCPDRDDCHHPWISADDGAGTIVKSTGKMYWGHKASTLSFANQEILLDAVAVNDAATHDSQTLAPHLDRLFTRHPDLKDQVSRVLDDGAADDPALKAELKNTFGIDLLAPINPRRRGPIRDDLPRGINHVTPRGVPVCQAGYPFQMEGFRRSNERFIFIAPEAEGESVCTGCPLRDGCYRGKSGGRRVTIAAERLPWLDPENPQLSKRFEQAMARRTVIERIHKLMKFDLGDDRLTKRGTLAFQARLDKTLLAMHILAAE